MAKRSEVSIAQRREAVLSLLRREEPATKIARRFGVSEPTLYRWRDEFLAGGEAGLSGSKGNGQQQRIHELENEIERAMAMVEEGKYIEISHLSEKIHKRSASTTLGLALRGSLKNMVEELEKTVISEKLAKNRGNKTRAADELGLSRYGLLKKMQRYGL